MAVVCSVVIVENFIRSIIYLFFAKLNIKYEIKKIMGIKNNGNQK
jgi:hypothetical protein